MSYNIINSVDTDMLKDKRDVEIIFKDVGEEKKKGRGESN